PFERDIWFYTMPYVANSLSIDIYIKKNRNKPDKILNLLAKLIYAINFLHQFDISHNDIQKQNILINEYEDPVLLDIFPARLSKYQYYEDFKQLFNLIQNSLNIKNDKDKNLQQILIDFFNFSYENQYDYLMLKKWLYEKANIKDQHLYFFQGSNITSVSSFRLNNQFEKIIEKLSSKNIILWEDNISLESLKDNFYAFLKVKVQNVIYIKRIDDLFEFLTFKSGQKIENISDLELYLNGKIFEDSIHLIFDDYHHIPEKEKSYLLKICKIYNDKIKLIRVETIENEKDLDWQYHKVYIDEESVLSVLKLSFNWYEFDFSNIGFDFSVSTLLNFLLFIKGNLHYFKADSNRLLMSKSCCTKIKNKFLDYIAEKYGVNNLTEEERIAIIIFLTFSKPVPLQILYSIDKYKIRKTTYLSLINKKILKFYKNINSLGLGEKIIKLVLEQKIKSENKRKYLEFQNYLYENWGNSIEDKKNYIKNIKTLNSKKLSKEILLFYENFSIFEYYADYYEVYDLIFNVNPKEDILKFIQSFKDYFYYSLATLDLKKLAKLKEKIRNFKSCKERKKDEKDIFEILISVVSSAISYNIEELDENIEKVKKYLDNPDVALILFYTYSNLLIWVEEAGELLQYVLKYLDKYTNLQYLFFLYGLAAFRRYQQEDKLKGIEDYYQLMSIIYNDSKEEKNWIFYLKASHNLAVYYDSLNTEESRNKSIEYTKESIYYNEKFKIYATLLISYSNLILNYHQIHRNHPEALEYLDKLQNFADEAYTINAIEDEQYLFSYVKALAYYIENWELSSANKCIKKIENNLTNPSKYPVYYEYLAFKGLYFLRTGKYDLALKILENMEVNIENKLYFDNFWLYFSLGFDIFLFLNDYSLLKKLEKNLLKLDKNRIENIIVDYDLSYLYSCIIFNIKIKKSMKEEILGNDYKFKNNLRADDFYRIYDYYKKSGSYETTSDLNKELNRIVSYSRYTGDIFYSFLDNYIAYLISKQKEFLLNALLSCKIIFSKLSIKEKKIFKSTGVIKKFLQINNSFSFYLSHDNSFNSFVEKSSENVKISFDILNKFFEKFKDSFEEGIEEIFNYILHFLINLGYCTYAAIYKVDESYSIKIVNSLSKSGYKRFSLDYFERCFKIFLTQSSPFIIQSISYDGLKPHIFVAIPILDLSGKITRKGSSSVYKFDEYSYFLIFETQKIINPYWFINGEFTTFLENILSLLNNQYLLVQENMYDPLTKVLVRNNFYQKLKNALSRIKSGTLLFIDIDNFKLINDLYSHDVGDKVLSKVASTIKTSVRKVDIVGRYGGEEFLVFIPLITKEAAMVIAERIRNNVMDEVKIKDQKITVTIGLSTYPEDSIFSDILISKAEMATRYGKLTGKNKTVIYNDNISLESSSKQYINGLIVRDPIKTSENAKILIELMQLNSYEKKDFILKLQKGFELIQKTIYYDYYIIFTDEKILVSNNYKIFENIIENIVERFDNLNLSGLIKIEDSIFNYCIAKMDNFYFCIGNLKNSQYLQEQITLFQLYCETLLLEKADLSNI
ncbi:MAG: diguanylate cyclase, partial [Exilispira sp.]